jgi:hypothetical protein
MKKNYPLDLYKSLIEKNAYLTVAARQLLYYINPKNKKTCLIEKEDAKTQTVENYSIQSVLMLTAAKKVAEIGRTI